MKELFYLFFFMATLFTVSNGLPSTWAELSMHYHYNLQADIGIDHIQWLGSHNSFNYLRDDYNGSIRRPGDDILSQYLPFSEQIDLGVRHFELKLHYVPSFPNPYMVCNGNELIWEACYNPDIGACSQLLRIEDLGPENTGCFEFYDRSLLANLIELQYDVLRRTPYGNFYIIHLTPGYNLTNEAFTDILNDFIFRNLTNTYVYTPADYAADLGQWPTLNDMRARGKRIMFYGYDTSTTAFPVSMVHTDITPHILPASFVVNFNNETCDGFFPLPSFLPFIHFVEDTTRISTYFSASDLAGRFTEDSMLATLKCGWGLNLMDIDEDKIALISWIWDYNEPSVEITDPVTDNCVIMNRNTGRWRTSPCTRTRAFCCKNSYGEFVFSSNREAGTATPSCEPGYDFEPPVTLTEQTNLYDLTRAQGATCWINALAVAVEDVPEPYEPPVTETEETTGTEDELPPIEFNSANGNLLQHCDINISQVLVIPTGGQELPAGLDVCDWEAYINGVVDNSIGFIVFTVIILVLSIVFWIGICVFFCHTCCGEDDEDAEEGNGAIDYVLYSIPVIAALIGLVIILIGNGNTSAAFDVAVDEIQRIFDDIEEIAEDGQAQYNTLTKYFDPALVDSILNTMTQSLAEIESVIIEINTQKDLIDGYRSTGTIIFGIIPIAFIALGFIFHKCGFSCCVTIFMIIADILIIIIVVIMVIHFSLGVVQTDVCQELLRDDGILVLMREAAEQAFEGVDVLINDAVPEIIQDGCDQLIEICNLDGQNCEQTGDGCTTDDVRNALETITVFDDGRSKLLSECAETCIDPDLQSLSEEAVEVTSSLLEFDALLDKIRELLEGIVSGDTIQNFADLFCTAMGSALTMMYIGCALASIALITSIVMLIILGW